jgi:tetratricopeptide (TPR) repeat protein
MSDKAAIIKEAQKYLARGQLDKAIAEWEKLVKESPDGNTLNTIGDLYLKKGDKANALESFHKAAHFFREEGFSLKALALYKKILNLKPTDVDSLLALGELNEAKGLATDAIRFYLAAADSLSKEGEKERLLEVYEKILSLSPSNIPLRSKVAEIYEKTGLISEAVKQYLNIARIHDEKGDTGKSIEFYKKVLTAQPVTREAILELNTLYERSGKLESAIQQIQEAAQLFPQDTDVLLRTADLQIKLQQLSDAEESLRQTIEIEPANIKARRLIGNLYLKKGDREKAWAEYLAVLDEILLEENYDDAINLLSSFKDLDPLETGKRLVSLYTQLGDNLQAANELTTLGEVFLDREKTREALNCYREALKMLPDDEELKTKVVELEKEVGKEYITVGPEKTLDEALLEADIYLRYGLNDKASLLLEDFAQRYPDNVDIHLRMKSLYSDAGEKEKAIAECLLLNDLYKKSGDTISSQQVLRDAYAIDPDDPRLVDLQAPPPAEEAELVSEGVSIEEYSEELSEADFYAKQGLIDEARAILERLKSLFPENSDINQRLVSLGQVGEGEQQETYKEETVVEQSLSEVEAVELEEVAEPALEGDVVDIFNEFKKGLEKELDEEDYETHYNLGIAYKEMGLIDDAIREFQMSKKEPKRFIHSSNMLGICYIEKGLFPLAIEVLKDGLEKMIDRGEAYWAMQYDLAEAYEKNGNVKEALDFYTQIYGWNAKFRDVADKVNNLKVIESREEKKPKEKKDRVSYL